MKLYITFDKSYRHSADRNDIDFECLAADICIWQKDDEPIELEDCSAWYGSNNKYQIHREVCYILSEVYYQEFFDLIFKAESLEKFDYKKLYDLDEYPDIKQYIEKHIKIGML